jgi:AhpD family alkylhydroperoxidase
MSEKNQRFMKRLYGPQELFKQLEAMMVILEDLKSSRGESRIGKPFIERIMMAVTEVNGCRYCSYFHTKVALKEGINKSEVDQLLSGNFSNTPHTEIPALLFAQHYAESRGEPEGEAIEHLEKTYGRGIANQIRAYIRMIMIGNTYGNAFDALLVRVKGKPADGSSLLNELGVLCGPFWMIPVIALKKLSSRHIPMGSSQ